MTGHPELVIAAPMRIEALALRGAVPGARLLRTGMGPRRAAAAARGLAGAGDGWALAVVGVCAGLDPRMRPGDVVVASEVRRRDGTVRCDKAGLLVAALDRRGLHPYLGPVLSVDHVVQGEERARLLATGAIAADMESAFLAGAVADGGRLAVLRVVLDAPGRELKRPGLAVAVARALRALRRSAPALQEWSSGNATTMQSASRNPGKNVVPMAQALLGGRGGSELPPHGSGNPLNHPHREVLSFPVRRSPRWPCRCGRAFGWAHT